MTSRALLPGGRAVDVVAEKDGKRIAIEIETGKSDSIYNIRKDLEAGFEKIIVVAFSQEIEDRISAEITSFPSEGRVIVTNPKQFFPARER